MKNKSWVNFKELRQRLDFAAVLRHYHVDLKVKGEQATGLCPLPTHPRHEGKRRSPSFSVNFARGIWQCFGCGGKGNAIEFAACMEGLDPQNAADFCKVALMLQERFNLGGSAGEVPRSPDKPGTPKEPVPPAIAAPDRAIEINTPLDFELQKLDSSHPYLAKRGLTPATIARFGLGYCSRGLMAGRIAIPLHDRDGALLGYAGRLVDDAAIDADHPKYKLPGDRERDGVLHQFRKSLIVYNAHAIVEPVDDLIVVEGLPSVWWLWQASHVNVVALIGTSCSPEQAEIIVDLVNPAGRIWLCPDSDDAGDRCAATVLPLLAPHRSIRWVKLDRGRQPTDLQPAELAEHFGPP